MKDRLFLGVMGGLTLLFSALTVFFNLSALPSAAPAPSAVAALTALFPSSAAEADGAGADAEPVSASAPGNSAAGASSAPPAAALSQARASSRKSSAKTSSALSVMNVNTAGFEQLEALPGIGSTLAGRIIAYRQQHGAFRSVDDLKNVKGIGDKLLAKIQPYLTVG